MGLILTFQQEQTALRYCGTHIRSALKFLALRVAAF